MHVCLINSRFPPETYGGAENYVLRTAKSLLNQGHEVNVISTCRYNGISSLRPKEEMYKGVKVWRFYPLNVSYKSSENPLGVAGKAIWHQIDAVNPHARRIVGKLLNRLEPDLVHTNNLMGISAGIGQAVQNRGMPHVHTLHDFGLICPKSNLVRELTASGDNIEVCESPPTPCQAYASEKRSLLGTPDVVTGPSNHVIETHRRQGFFDGIRSERVQLGVTEVADAAPAPPDRPTVLYVGKQLQAKGIETLIDAAGRLQEIEFHVCGSGPYEDETSDRASQLSNCQYHGYVEVEKLKRLRRSSSVAVVPSIWMENSPMTIYESYAEGIPVVGSDIGGIPEIVSPGETGALFKPGDVDSLVNCIRNVVGDDGEQRRLRRNALEFARNHTTEAHVRRLIANVYRPALDAVGS